MAANTTTTMATKSHSFHEKERRFRIKASKDMAFFQKNIADI